MPDSAPGTPLRRPPSPAGSLSGMGIAFHTANPLPPPLHDTWPPSAFPLLRSYSDDHRERQQNGRTLASHQTSSVGVPGSAAPSASSSGGNLNLRGGVHRNSFSHSSPADRAPTVPPAPPSHSSSAVRPSLPPLAAPRPAHAQTARPAPPTSSFAMSSSIGLQTNEPRGRVVSPQQGHPADSPSPSPATSAAAPQPSPYDPPHLAAARRSENGYAPALFHPLTGKEAQYGSTPTVHPAKVPFTESAAYWLALYFVFNLGLTLFNKFVLVSFPFPYTLTGLHALSGCAGCYIALERGAFTPARLTRKENVVLGAFSVLYTINIAVSNISLQLVTVPFHQVVRASTPLFTIFISSIFLRTRFSIMKLVSLLPVVAGVGFATYGDYYFTAWGLILTLLGTFLAALKTVVTNLIQTGGGGRLKLHPLDLLMRMSPLAFIQCVIYGWYTGELERVRAYGATQMTSTKAVALLVNGVIACGLNIVSFTANKKAGALTMTVSANCKQVLTIALAVVLFNLHITPTNGIGILLTLIGGGWYGYVEYKEKNKKSKVLDRT
ncbi:hypothetical protein C351_06492 [Cryptococcus neoformans c8]|nr:hypothetical protein C353_06461 [Cryptococcus neoformans var. grubii AD1-83a]OXG46531.1 hypothetical protein C354_06448 [Cryptococcus neoformans var. grubii MW-RSA1955]OXG49809.1 hypothetical protein C352_06466 [Cryptococcus neoformans var. grubii CHC193]OXG57560.1 hypothetical protein C351_06492 [Cryptococcus neoformans var. grubii c8]OXH01852.1 hypothetical protein C369_06584 [Cryptococcus neoformans var. grubii A5-35-17]OXH03065.1 hypothetical protein C370_06644 [Cryptococcus neoformans 